MNRHRAGADQTSWRLLEQTNNLAVRISANTNDWMTVARFEHDLFNQHHH
jgi:hypothetical protein